MRSLSVLPLAGLLLQAIGGAAQAAPPEFWPHWGDGKAELDAYRLSQPRYGAVRDGILVWIFVTEDFSESARVKADPGKHPAADVFPVFKLNAVKDFQTGLYDYNLMTSVFTSVEPRYGRFGGQPTKIVFSSQEWCGAMFEHLLFSEKSIARKRFSYFDGEGDQSDQLEPPKDLLTVEGLPVLVRGLLHELLRPGEKKSFTFLPSIERGRLLHRSFAWDKGSLSRADKTERITVTAGSFEVERYTAVVGKETYHFLVERAYPRRIVRYEVSDGETAELVGSVRLPYWELNGPGQEAVLEKMGLSARLPAAAR